MKGRQVTLSRRLEMLARMVTPGNRAVDVGCDHGFLAIRLIQQGICPHVLAMDVRRGPLAAASEHVEGCGLGAYIETRLSDGLWNMAAGEADTAVCAGMGGPLMIQILRESMEKAKGMKELILQPQSELGAFRRFLRETGFRIVDEDAVREGGKYYFAMKAVWAGEREPRPEDGAKQRLYDEYGEILLERRHPVLEQYLLFRRGITAGILEKLAGREGGRAADRREELREELTLMQAAWERFKI